MNVRARMAAAFVVGVAVGALLVGAGLWWSGSLRTQPFARGATPPDTAPVDVNGIVAEAKNLPRPAVPDVPPPGFDEPVPPATAPPSATKGEADRMAPEIPLKIAPPIEGIKTRSIPDTFADARDGRKHEALDIMAPKGTPVHAIAEGNVVKLFTSKQGGLTVYQFDDSRTYCFYYAHLDRYAPGLTEGTLLRKGDVLGYVGSTGDASPSAPHLHLALFKLGPEKHWWQGTAIDPRPLLQ